MNSKQCAKMCGKLVADSQLVLEGIEWKWASIYVTLNTKPWQVHSWGLIDVVPRRRFKSGPLPSVKGAGDPMAEYRWKWSKGPEKFTEQEKRILFSNVVEVMVLATLLQMDRQCVQAKSRRPYWA